MLRLALLVASLTILLPLGDPEPTPSPSPEAKPTPKLSAPSPKPTEKPKKVVALEKAEPPPKAEALREHRMRPYDHLPLAPSYAGPQPTYRPTQRDFDRNTAGYDAPGRAEAFKDTERSYGRPAHGYGAPSHGYAAPVEDFCYAKTHFKTTWHRMTQYRTHWATKRQIVPFTMYKYVTATSYWPTTYTEWKEVVKTLPYRYVAKTQVVFRTKTLVEKHQDYTNTEYVWHTQNYMDHHTVTKHITRYATKTNYYTDTVTEYVQKPVYYTETATVYEAKYHTKKVTEPYYETIYVSTEIQ